MSFISLVLIALGLSMDAFAVSVTNGIIAGHQNEARIKDSIILWFFSSSYAYYRVVSGNELQFLYN